jgi:hypothetical protein
VGTSWQLIAELDALARAAGERGLVTVVDAPADLAVDEAVGDVVLRHAEEALEGAVEDPSARVVLLTLGRDGNDLVLDALHDGLGDGACRRFVITTELSRLPAPPAAPPAPEPRRR